MSSFGEIQPRLSEPILIDDPVPSVAYKKGSAFRRGAVVIFRGQTRDVFDIRTKLMSVSGRPCFERGPDDPTIAEDIGFEECPRLPLKQTVTHVKIAEGWVPISQVKLKKV